LILASRLTTVLSIVHDDAIAVILEQRITSRHVGGHVHQMAQESDVALGRPSDACEPRSVLWDHQEMAWGHWSDVSECQSL